MSENKIGDMMMEMFGNSLGGMLSGASNKLIEDAIMEAVANPDDRDAAKSVFDAIFTRLRQCAHIIVPGCYMEENKLFVYGTWMDMNYKGTWFIGFTSHDYYVKKAGSGFLQIPLKGLLLQALKEENISGVVINPGMAGGGWLLPKNVIIKLLKMSE